MEIAFTIHEKYFVEFIKSIEYFNLNYSDKKFLIHMQYNDFESKDSTNVIFNTEQLSIEHWKNKLFIVSLYHPIFDYSNENIKIIKSLN